MIAKSYYIIHPNWDKGVTQSGLDTGESYYEESENPPGWFYPTSGTIISAPKNSPAKKGDTLYFTWNGFDYKNCISPREDKNIFVIKEGIFAFKHKEVIRSIEYILLDKIPMGIEMADNGLILSGAVPSGDIFNPQIVQEERSEYLHGIVKYTPIDAPYTQLFNPITKKDEDIVLGKKICIYDCSDVGVFLDDQKLYRTRYLELIYLYD